MATRVGRKVRRPTYRTWHPAPSERQGRPWSITILRALNPDGTLLWPGMMSLEAYADLYQSGGAALFMATRMQDPSGLQGAVFRPEWLQWYVHADYVDPQGTTAEELLSLGHVQAILPEPGMLIAGLAADFALSQAETADSYARLAGYGDAEGRMFIDDVLVLGQRDLTPEAMLDDLLNTAQRYRVAVAGLESVGFQAIMKWLVSKRAPRVPWRDLGPKGSGKHDQKPGNRRMLDKVLRARLGLQPAYERGKVYHRLDMRNREAFETTLIAFPGGAHDDPVDGAMYLWQCLSDIDPVAYRDASDLMDELRGSPHRSGYENVW